MKILAKIAVANKVSKDLNEGRDKVLRTRKNQ
jgi:hypothetical protein